MQPGTGPPHIIQCRIEEIAAIEALIGDLEKRLRKLYSSALHASDFSAEVTGQVRESPHRNAVALSGNVAGEAGRLGIETWTSAAKP